MPRLFPISQAWLRCWTCDILCPKRNSTILITCTKELSVKRRKSIDVVDIIHTLQAMYMSHGIFHARVNNARRDNDFRLKTSLKCVQARNNTRMCETRRSGKRNSASFTASMRPSMQCGEIMHRCGRRHPVLDYSCWIYVHSTQRLFTFCADVASASFYVRCWVRSVKLTFSKQDKYLIS